MSSLKKRFGQHFLHDDGVLGAIAQACAAAQGAETFEIGPGGGALTAHLLHYFDHLHVVEIDRDLIADLRRRFSAERVQVHEADALRFSFCASQGASVRVVGNLPYNISSPLIFHLLQQPCIQGMVFLLQKEVVDRLAASPGGGDYGRLSVMVQMQCEVTSLFCVPPDAFIPPPKVESRLVYLKPVAPRVPAADRPLFAEIVSRAFSQRRKMLRQNLKAYLASTDWVSLGIDPTRRAETLSVEEFAALAAYVRVRAPVQEPESAP